MIAMHATQNLHLASGLMVKTNDPC